MSTDIPANKWLRDGFLLRQRNGFSSTTANRLRDACRLLHSQHSALSLRLKIQYVSDDWLFIQKYFIHHGQETLEIQPKPNEVERDNGIVGGSHRTWEWYDSPIPTDQIRIWKAISASSEVTLRYEGKQYQKDQKLELDEMDRVAVVLDAFSLLGGD